MTITRKQRTILGAIVFAAATALIVAHFIPGRQQKQKPMTVKEQAQNECSLAVYKNYLRNQLAITKPSETDPLSFLSVEKTVAKRRLQEQFCLDFVRCLPKESDDASLTAMVEATRFDNCLKGEALDEYDAVPREDSDDDTPQRDD